MDALLDVDRLLEAFLAPQAQRSCLEGAPEGDVDSLGDEDLAGFSLGAKARGEDWFRPARWRRSPLRWSKPIRAEWLASPSAIPIPTLSRYPLRPAQSTGRSRHHASRAAMWTARSACSQSDGPSKYTMTPSPVNRSRMPSEVDDGGDARRLSAPSTSTIAAEGAEWQNAVKPRRSLKSFHVVAHGA